MLTRNKPMSRGKAPEREARPDRSAEFATARRMVWVWWQHDHPEGVTA